MSAERLTRREVEGRVKDALYLAFTDTEFGIDVDGLAPTLVQHSPDTGKPVASFEIRLDIQMSQGADRCTVCGLPRKQCWEPQEVAA